MTLDTGLALVRRQDLNATLACCGRLTEQDAMAMRVLLEKARREDQYQAYERRLIPRQRQPEDAVASRG